MNVMENKTVSEFDRIYNKKWEELVKGGVSTLDDPVSGVSEAHFQAYVYAEEITGTLARQYWPIVMDGKKNKTMEEFAMKEFDYGYGSAKAEIEEFGMDDDIKEVFEIDTEEPEDFLNIVPGTLKGLATEFTTGYLR
mgnify:CR=1 FL=1